MKISVHFEAQLRQAAGVAKAETELPTGCRMSEALQIVAAQFGVPLRDRLLASDGSPQRSVPLFVNDHPVAHLAAADQCLHDGDVLMLLPPISGG